MTAQMRRIQMMKQSMQSITRSAGALLVAGLIGVGAFAQSAATPEPVTAYRVGKVVTMDDDERIINNAVVLVRGTKIIALGRASEVAIPEGATVHSFPDLWLTPGLVEAHNHIGGSMNDLHDYVYLTNPGLSTRDTVSPNNNDSKRGLAAGVTTALLIPGSGTNMSGFGTLIKFGGETLDEVILKHPASIKVAQAGNPERYWFRVGRQMMNYNTRHTMNQALRYHQSWEAFEKGETEKRPAFDPTYEDFRGLFRGEFIASVHTQQYQVVLATITLLGNELNVPTMLDHSTFDGFRTAPLINENDRITTIVGPRQLYLDRAERRVHGIAARYAQANVRVLGINTDSPVIPQEELFYQAAMACWYGWNSYAALKGVTRAPAEAMLINDRVGTIAVGYDADFGLWTGDPIDPRSTCRMTVVNGRIVYDGRQEPRF